MLRITYSNDKETSLLKVLLEVEASLYFKNYRSLVKCENDNKSRTTSIMTAKAYSHFCQMSDEIRDHQKNKSYILNYDDSKDTYTVDFNLSEDVLSNIHQKYVDSFKYLDLKTFNEDKAIKMIDELLSSLVSELDDKLDLLME